jgi:2-polyprenyl-6-methoxyphenol hydroxylase-like FAD-dependent oxidoreductase
MTGAVERVLVIGGGFSGMSAAIELRKRDIAVDLLEIDEGWRSYGAGITLGGPTLRALRTLGILDAFLERGSATDGVHLRTADGHRIATLPTPRIAGPDIPGSGGIMRPVLAAILSEATRASGTTVRLGQSFKTIAPDHEGVDVVMTTGERRRYDLVIGADGLFSSVRKAILPQAPAPAYTGQAVWRAVVDRPREVDTVIMWFGPRIKLGITPVSTTQAYLFVTEDRPEKRRIDDSEHVSLFKTLLAPFSDPLAVAIRDQIGVHSSIVYRPLEGLLVPLPWHQGRVVLIGDAVHATTPHLASGACIGIEDAIVLAQEIERADGAASAIEAFEARRWERCRMVVQNSLRLGEIEIHDGDRQEHAGIMRQSLMALAQPI